MLRPRRAKEVSCESKISTKLLGFHLFESCLKLNEDCLKKFTHKTKKEQLKGVTEDVAELKLIIKTTGPSMPLLTEEEQSNELTELDFLVLQITFDL